MQTKAAPTSSAVAEVRGSAGWARYLAEVSLFSEIKSRPGALETLAAQLKEIEYPPHATIIAEGETGSELYFLLEGQASVYKTTAEGEEYKVAILTHHQHAFFGEGGLLDSEARSATIRADSKCRCLVLNRQDFMSFGEAHAEWALPVLIRIARAVMARVRKTNNDLMLLYNALVAEIRGN